MVANRGARLVFDDLDELAAYIDPDNPKRHDLAAIDSSFCPLYGTDGCSEGGIEW